MNTLIPLMLITVFSILCRIPSVSSSSSSGSSSSSDGESSGNEIEPSDVNQDGTTFGNAFEMGLEVCQI